MARHLGTIDKHGNRWRVRLMVRGKRHSFTLPEGASCAEAVQFSYDKAAELRRRGGVLPDSRMRFSELLARYREGEYLDMAPSTKRTHNTGLRAISTFFVEMGGDPDVRDIGRGAVNAFLTWRRRHGPSGTPLRAPLSAGSIRNERMRLHGLFTFAEGLEVVEHNPVKKTKAPKGDSRSPVILTAVQYEALIDAFARAQAVAEAIPDRSDEVADLVRRALKSDAAGRARSAGRALREVPFALPRNGTILEGFVDLVIETESGIEIVDWKTDNVSKAEIAERLKEYELQAGLYVLGIEEATRKTVRRVTYVFVRAGAEQSPGDPASLRASALARLDEEARGAGRE